MVAYILGVENEEVAIYHVNLATQPLPTTISTLVFLPRQPYEQLGRIPPWLLNVNSWPVRYLICNSSGCFAMMITQLACVLGTIMRLPSDDGDHDHRYEWSQRST